MPLASESSLFSPDLERLSGVFLRLSAQLARPAVELGMLVADPVFWGWGVKRGDGHSVLALPGLGGGDRYLQPLRTWVRRIGYQPLESGIDINPGWSEELAGELGGLVERQFKRTGSPLTIIGHSLGGVLGYAIAARRPYMVRQLITLASPLQYIRRSLPPSVPIVAFYSRADSIVRYPAAVASDPHARNIEVAASHIGIAAHPEVYRKLGELLRMHGSQATSRSN
ncbi:MAG TPA: hypothetical protein VJ728_17525 [Candidatus Binataceae bacterium]|nr:hypothetical protein [Candidatus Binataceae bacterium]